MTALSDFGKRAVSIIFLLCSIWVVAIVFFFQGLTIPSWVRKEFLLPNFILLAAGIVFVMFLKLLFDKREINIKRVALIVFVLQVAVVYCYYFSSDWDAGCVLSRAWNAATGAGLDVPEGYYSQNTNNVMMHLLEYGVFRLCVLCGIKEYIKAYFVLVVLNCIVYGLVGVMLYDAALLINHGRRGSANLCYCLYAALVISSPWVSVVYTDGMGIMFPILNIWLYLRHVNKERSLLHEVLFLAFMGALALVCYSFKATTVVSSIAVVISELLRVLGTGRSRLVRDFSGFIMGMAAFCIVFLAAGSGFKMLYTACGVVLDKEMACPFTHYLKMGFNDYEVGTFNFEDAEESAYIQTYQERYDQNLSKAKERIRALLPFGIFKFEARKSLVIYHDGTFSYGIEGEFYADGLADRIPVASPFFKRIFWHTGDLYPYLALFQQMLWLVVLVSSIFFGSPKNRSGEIAIKLTIIGIFLFLALFESRARFIFAYVPVYIAAAAASIDKLSERWRGNFG